MTSPRVVSPPISRKATRSPATKASATCGETASRLGSTPLSPITVTTAVVATATLTTLAELRISWVRAATTPYRERSTALKMELLLGELNIPMPVLWNMSIATMKMMGDCSARPLARMKEALAEMAIPPIVSALQPNLSDRRPLRARPRSCRWPLGSSGAPRPGG